MFLKDLPAELSIKCGNLCYKPVSVSQKLCSSVRMILTESNDENLLGFLGRSGSASLINLRGKLFVVVMKHSVFGERNSRFCETCLEQIRIPTSGGSPVRNILIDGTVFVTSENDEEYEDIILLKAQNQSSDNNPDFFSFFPIRKFDRSKIKLSFFVGYPMLNEQMEFNEIGHTEHISMTVVFKDCSFDENFRSHTKYFQRFLYNPNEEIPENGLSGGAVFSIVETKEGMEVFLHALITRAGNGKLYGIDVDFLFCVPDE